MGKRSKKSKDVTVESNIQANDFDQLYGDMKSFFKSTLNGQLNVAAIPTLTRYAMQLVQTGLQWKQMAGSEKKTLVMGVVVKIVKDLINDPDVTKNLDPNVKSAILVGLDIVPTIIDVAVDFAKTYHDDKTQATAGATVTSPKTNPPGCGCF